MLICINKNVYKCKTFLSSTQLSSMISKIMQISKTISFLFLALFVMIPHAKTCNWKRLHKTSVAKIFGCNKNNGV